MAKPSFEITLTKYGKYNPTCWDSRSNYMGNTSQDHWYVAPVIKTRDASILELSNFEYAENVLKAGKTPGCVINGYGHWACGHYDLILIHPWRHDLLELAQEMQYTLEDYPLLDEDDFCQKEYEETERLWDSYGYEDLSKELAERLCLDDLVSNQYELRSFVEQNNPVLDSEGNFQNRAIQHLLNYSLSQDLWKYVKSASIPQDALDSLSSADWHEIYLHKVQLTLDTDPVEVPVYIAVQYDDRQLKI